MVIPFIHISIMLYSYYLFEYEGMSIIVEMSGGTCACLTSVSINCLILIQLIIIEISINSISLILFFYL
jgi:hypothetical protein